MSINRIEKVNSLLEQEISKILLREFNFTDVMVTLTRVETSGNLFEAKVYISVYPDGEIDRIIEILNKSAYTVQYQLNRLLKMRPVPRIKFYKDKKVKEAGKVEELLYKIRKGKKDKEKD